MCIQVKHFAELHAAGHNFQGRAVNVKVHVGPVTKEVRAAIVPDRIISLPLIGVDIGESEMIDALVYAKTTKLGSQGGQFSNVAKERAVQTRQQIKKNCK